MLATSIAGHTVRIGPRFAVSFQRTLRIPDDGRTYPLPPGLGVFPIFDVADYADRVPADWREQPGAFIPMYQREALWLGFDGAIWKPNAVKVAIGRINAVSGAPYDEQLHADPQDYLVCPDQPWLDGIVAGDGSIRQFVAMPLGLGYTVEASITGVEMFGGIQIVAFEPKPGRFPDQAPPPPPPQGRFAMPQASAAMPSMGLGAGGMMKQKIYADPYGIDVWDQDNFGHAVIHIVNSSQFRDITGREPPPTPVDAEVYTSHGLPWFDLYDDGQAHIAPSRILGAVKSVAQLDREREIDTDEDASIDLPKEQVVTLPRAAARPTTETPGAPASPEDTPDRR